MQTFTAPDPLNGETLRSELQAAGVTMGDELPLLIGSDLHLDVAEADRAAVQQVLVAHLGQPSPDAAAMAYEEFRAAVEAAASIADLKAAILGTQVVVRPDPPVVSR